jgi:hypothetical protein
MTMTMKLLIFMVSLLMTSDLIAGDSEGFLTANGQNAVLKYAVAYEIDSTTEPGFMDVVVVISDRQITETAARDREKLETMAKNKELAGLRVVINPDAKVMSAEPLHSAFKSFIGSGLWVKWEPSAYDEKQVAGRFYTEGMQNEFGQKWQYDVSFSAPIMLDPEAKNAKQ